MCRTYRQGILVRGPIAYRLKKVRLVITNASTDLYELQQNPAILDARDPAQPTPYFPTFSTPASPGKPPNNLRAFLSPAAQPLLYNHSNGVPSQWRLKAYRPAINVARHFSAKPTCSAISSNVFKPLPRFRHRD
jgi:hypothetical protein